jgi:patatin-like phospholipase/acyl hydrolase
VRGISCLYMLKKLMAQVRCESSVNPEEDKNPRSCYFFDLICGTNTGELIALMLGRMKMVGTSPHSLYFLSSVLWLTTCQDISDIIKCYDQMSKEIFTSKSENPKAAFDHKVLIKCIKDVLTSPSVGLDAEFNLKDEYKHNAKTFVVSVSLKGSGAQAVRVRTYSTKTSDPYEAKIWETACTTSAAPTFFEPMATDGIHHGDGRTG